MSTERIASPYIVVKYNILKFGFLLGGHVALGSFKIVYRWVTTNCCLMTMVMGVVKRSGTGAK